MLVFPIVGLLYFSIVEIVEIVAEYKVLSEMEKIKHLSVFAIKSSNLVHELQKERGMTAGYIASKGKKFAIKLPEQRRVVDKRLTELKLYLSEYDVKDYGGDLLNELVNKISSELDVLRSKREAVTSLTISVKDAIGYYTGLNTKLLSSVGQIATLSSNSEVSRLASTYINFLQSKEERAVLSGAFSVGHFSEGMYEKYLQLVVEKNIFMNVFKTFVHSEQMNFLENTLKGKNVGEVNRYRKIASNTELHSHYNYDESEILPEGFKRY